MINSVSKNITSNDNDNKTPNKKSTSIVTVPKEEKYSPNKKEENSQEGSSLLYRTTMSANGTLSLALQALKDLKFSKETILSLLSCSSPEMEFENIIASHMEANHKFSVAGFLKHLESFFQKYDFTDENLKKFASEIPKPFLKKLYAKARLLMRNQYRTHFSLDQKNNPEANFWAFVAKEYKCPKTRQLFINRDEYNENYERETEQHKLEDWTHILGLITETTTGYSSKMPLDKGFRKQISNYFKAYSIITNQPIHSRIGEALDKPGRWIVFGKNEEGEEIKINWHLRKFDGHIAAGAFLKCGKCNYYIDFNGGGYPVLVERYTSCKKTGFFNQAGLKSHDTGAKSGINVFEIVNLSENEFMERVEEVNTSNDPDYLGKTTKLVLQRNLSQEKQTIGNCPYFWIKLFSKFLYAVEENPNWQDTFNYLGSLEKSIKVNKHYQKFEYWTVTKMLNRISEQFDNVDIEDLKKNNPDLLDKIIKELYSSTLQIMNGVAVQHQQDILPFISNKLAKELCLYEILNDQTAFSKVLISQNLKLWDEILSEFIQKNESKWWILYLEAIKKDNFVSKCLSDKTGKDKEVYAKIFSKYGLYYKLSFDLTPLLNNGFSSNEILKFLSLNNN